MEETVTISKLRLQDLEHSELKLSCLETHGVDNWVGYEDAMSDYFDMIEMEETENAKENGNA